MVDTPEFDDASQTQRGRTLLAIAARALVTGRRFPLASRGLLSIFDQAIYSGTSFFTAALIGRSTSPTELGLYYLVLSIVLIMSGVQEQLVAAPYVVYSKRRKGQDLAEYAGSMWAHYLVATWLAVVGLVVAILVLSVAGQSKILPGLWASGAPRRCYFSGSGFGGSPLRVWNCDPPSPWMRPSLCYNSEASDCSAISGSYRCFASLP